MSRLRARCPDCRTLTAVALEEEYECHACGRRFPAGLVRVPRAWGSGGEKMAEAAYLPLPYPEAGVVEERTLTEQNLAVACALPQRPLVLGGCCCAHVGAVEGLAARSERLGVVWLDAHGDLQTPASSPSGNLWGMPLRMLLETGTVDAGDAVLVGARNLDPAEEEFIGASGLRIGPDGISPGLEGVDAVYAAVDLDVFDPDEPVAAFMPEEGGLTLAEAEALLARIRRSKPVIGAGFTGLAAVPENARAVARLAAALGF